MSAGVLTRSSAPDNNPAGEPLTRTRRSTLLHGGSGDPSWVRPALLALLAATGLLYLWDLAASGNANEFYAAAVQAGSQSWKAWFFGSIDTANFITVDKPPASLWVMGLSARIFGYSSWSLLVPQAAMGVATVGLLFAAVRRVAGPVAGLLAGALLALTPAAVLIFRFDNPDALLLLLLVTASYCMTRALDGRATRWVVLAGVALGFAFLTKSAQALLVVSPLGLAFLVAGRGSVVRRLGQLVLGLLAMVVSAGWWFTAVSLWPASDRPYIGGSTNNNPLELAFGYNGLARLFGGSGNGGGGGGGTGSNTSFGGSTGLTRMFNGEFGLEISWLLPAALLALVALVALTWSAARTDRLRAATLIWGGSLLVTGITFSFMQGTIHPYYSVALAPSIAALVGIGADRLWRRRTAPAHLALIVGLLATATWGLILLHRNDAGLLLQGAVLLLGVAALAGLVLRATGPGRVRRLAPALALALSLAVAAPTASWGVQTATTAHTGSIPTAVSSGSAGGMGSSRGMGGGMGGGSGTTSSALVTALEKSTTTWSAATVGATSAAGLELSSNTAVLAVGGFSGSDDAPTLSQFKAMVKAGRIHYFVAGGGMGGGPAATRSTSTSASGSSQSGRPSGTPPAAKAGTGRGMGDAGGSSSQITSWVTANYTKTTIGGTTVYDLTDPT